MITLWDATPLSNPRMTCSATVRDTSPTATISPAIEGATETEPRRHVLPKNLRNAVKHLSDGELDLMHAATLEEMKRRSRTQQGVETSLPARPDMVKITFRAGVTLSRIARQFSTASRHRGLLDVWGRRWSRMKRSGEQMTIKADLVELERQHKALEREIAEALGQTSIDDLKITELKRRKLMLKDEIERVRHDHAL